MSKVWTPMGGLATFDERRAAAAVEEYDEDLKLGQQPDGEWVVFLTRSAWTRAGHPPHPVFSLGYELPTPERLVRTLAQHDVRRNGKKIVDDLVERNEKRKQAYRAAADEGAAISAEHMEFYYRQLGGAGAASRAFIGGE